MSARDRRSRQVGAFETGARSLVTAGVAVLALLGLVGAVLVGETSHVPTRRDPSPSLDAVRPPPPQAAEQGSASSEPDRMAALPPAPRAMPEPPPAADPAPAPAPEADVPPAQPPVQAAPPTGAPAEQPARRGRRGTRRSAHAPPANQEVPGSEAPPSPAPAPAQPPASEAPPNPAPAPPPAADAQPKRVPVRPPVDHRYDGVLTTAEIGRIKRSLRLSPDQEPYWPSLASVLREVGRRQMAQVDAGQRPTFDLPGDLSSRLYSAAMPLLGTLREDQKEVVRRRAKSLGLESVASYI